MNNATPAWTLVETYPFRQPERVFFNPYNKTEIWVTSFGNGMRTGNTGMYVFTGNGDWSIASNWRNGLIPSNTISNGMNVFIEPVAGGECTYNGSIIVQPGGVLNIKPGKNFKVTGSVIVQ